MTLGERLREIRKEKDLTKQELGNTLNVPKDRIKLYETGEETPSEQPLLNILILKWMDYYSLNKNSTAMWSSRTIFIL